MTQEELSAREGDVHVPDAVLVVAGLEDLVCQEPPMRPQAQGCPQAVREAQSTARLEELEAGWTLRTSARTGNRWVQLWQLACARSRCAKQPLAVC